MLLSCRILQSVSSVNSYEVTNAMQVFLGDTFSVYFQLIDSALDKPTERFYPSGRRFVPASGTTLSITLNSIDNAKKYVKTAIQPFPGDASIWKIDVAGTDQVFGSVNMILSLNQGGVITNGLAQNAILVYPLVGV